MKLHYLQTCKPRKSSTPVAVLSRDGRVLVSFEAFQRTEIVHLFSGIDDDRPSAHGLGANIWAITGYTEWKSLPVPAITIGWDWKLTCVQGAAWPIHTGVPGSNLMLLDQSGNDLGAEQTQQLLIAWLDVFSWQQETLMAVSI